MVSPPPAIYYPLPHTRPLLPKYIYIATATSKVSVVNIICVVSVAANASVSSKRLVDLNSSLPTFPVPRNLPAADIDDSVTGSDPLPTHNTTTFGHVLLLQ